MKRLIVTIMFAVLMFAVPVMAGSVTISFDAPTTNTDDTLLTDLAGFKVYYGNTSDNLNTSINISNNTAYTLENLLPSTPYYFAVTAYNTGGNESALSNIIGVNTHDAPPTPTTPSAVNIMIVCKDADGNPVTCNFILQ